MFNISSFVSDIYQRVNSFYQEEVYCQSSVVDIAGNFFSYSLIHQLPELKVPLTKIFNETLTTLLLDTQCYEKNILYLKEAGFTFLNTNIKASFVLNHPDLPDWIIKKNFSTCLDENNISRRIHKITYAHNIPHVLVQSNKKITQEWINISVPSYNDYNNPLRVEVLKRGASWIKKLGLKHLQVAEEYLYQLPNSSPHLPLHQKTIVFSKKIPLLDPQANITRYNTLAKNKPKILETIVKEICLFIKHTQILDNHLNNIRFIADGIENQVIFIDGEPGNLRDISQESINCLKDCDVSVFSIVGLRNLQQNIKNNFSRCSAVHTIFNTVIEQTIHQIIQERQVYWRKFWLSVIFPPYPITIMLSSTASTVINYLTFDTESNRETLCLDV